jgi:hypothetical protein
MCILSNEDACLIPSKSSPDIFHHNTGIDGMMMVDSIGIFSQELEDTT